jgi:DNA-binding CsgD family transcriptional regulator
MAEQITKWLIAISKSNEWLSKILRMSGESHKMTEKITK